jgi:hypothetical protein
MSLVVKPLWKSPGRHLKMDVRYFRKSRSTFYETHDGRRRPSAIEAPLSVGEEKSGDFNEVQSQV